MQARSVQFIAAACGGELLQGSPHAQACRVCTDSRQAQAGDLFVALVGEKHDAHAFLPAVAQKGVTAILGQKERLPADLPGCAVIGVGETRQALGRLAGAYRRDFQLPVVAVCGSNGKTSTKEVAGAVLSSKLNTLWNEGSFNNEIGVPLTLLRLEGAHQAAVVEAGTNHPGELGPLLDLIAPRYGILTSIGREHLEFFKDLEGVAREEGTLAEKLPAEGKLFLNGDSPWTESIAARCRAGVVRVGETAGNAWRLRSAGFDKLGPVLEVEAPRAGFSGQYRLQLLGRHQALNALFAIALGAELGLSRAQIEKGLAHCQPAKMRLQLFEWNGVRVLNDAYNANADSMSAALEVLQQLPCKGRRVAVLGDMGELGAYTETAHREVGRRAAELGIEQLFLIGRMAGATAQAARAAGLGRVLEFGEVDAAAAAVKSFVKSGDVLLLKASRSARLERVAELLRGAKA